MSGESTLRPVLHGIMFSQRIENVKHDVNGGHGWCNLSMRDRREL